MFKKKLSVHTCLLLVTTLFLFNSCSIPNLALKGKYSEQPFQVTTAKNKEEVWSKIIDIFATKGISIKIIDKSSGLIISESNSFNRSYTREDVSGNLIDKNAFIVIGDLRGGLNNQLEPQVISGDWNIRVKELNGETIINVNLVNLKCQYTVPASQYGPSRVVDVPIKSTGVFEKLIADMLK